jgi:HEAT repeat protein
VRLAAAQALGQLDAKAAAPALVKLLLNDSDSGVRLAAAQALGQLDAKDAGVPELVKLLDNSDSHVRLAAAQALGRLGAKDAVPALVKLLNDGDSHVRFAAAEALGRLGAKDAVPALVKVLNNDSDGDVRVAAARALGRLGAKEDAVPALVKLLNNSDSHVRFNAAWELSQLGAKDVAVPALLKLLNDGYSGVRRAAAQALGRLGGNDVVRALVKVLNNDSDGDVRVGAAQALGRLRATEASTSLVKLLNDSDGEYSRELGFETVKVRAAAAQALGQLGAKDAVPALVKVLSQNPPDFSVFVATDVFRVTALALGQLGPLDLGPATQVMEQAYGHDELVGEIRFLAHFFGGGRRETEIAIACLGGNAPKSCDMTNLTKAEAQERLHVLSAVWDAGGSCPRLRKDVADKVAMLAETSGWDPDDVRNLAYLQQQFAEMGRPYAADARALSDAITPSMTERVSRWIEASPKWLQASLALACVLLLWCFLLLVLWAFASRKLVELYEWLQMLPVTMAPDDLAGATVAVLLKALRMIGVAALLWLGTSRRALDAWIAAQVVKARDQFTRLKVVQDRQITVDLPVRLDGKRLDQLWSALDVLFRQPSVALLVAGPGGAGKTTLACQIGRRILGDEGPPIGGFSCLPLFIDRDLEVSETETGFVAFLTGALRAMVGVPRLSSKLVEALVLSGRVLVIVDGLSERNEITRRAFDPTRAGFPVMRLVVTSRNADRVRMSTVIETLAIPPDSLYSFINRYVCAIAAQSGTQSPGEADILEACAQLKRLLRDEPTTPLFAAMWSEEIGCANESAAKRIESVAELIDSYVERLLAPSAGGNAAQLDSLRLDLTAIALRELGDDLTPRWLTRTQVLGALRERDTNAPESRFDTLLGSRLTEADSRNSELIRIAQDPIAEHLAARARVEELAGDTKKWRAFLNVLRQRGRPAGFVDALRACLQARGYGHQAYPVSEIVKQQLVEANRT